MSEEIWKDVVGFEGIYQVSSLGRVKRVMGYQCRKERILKPQQHRSGYLSISLSRDGQVSRKSVHRMVLEAHVGPAPEGCEANHRNGNVTDNRVANLEWVTKSENNQHAYRVLGRDPPPVKGEANGRAKNTRENVLEIRKLYATGDYTQRELGRMFGVSDVCISLIVRRETWQHVA